MGDSALVLRWLAETRDVDLERGLPPLRAGAGAGAARAAGGALAPGVRVRADPARRRALAPGWAPAMQEHFRAHLYERGMLRHTPEEITAFGKQDLDAVAAWLDGRKWAVDGSPDAHRLHALGPARAGDLRALRDALHVARARAAAAGGVRRAGARAVLPGDRPSGGRRGALRRGSRRQSSAPASVGQATLMVLGPGRSIGTSRHCWGPVTLQTVPPASGVSTTPGVTQTWAR